MGGLITEHTLDGFSLLQQLERRLGDSRVFLGANFRYSSFDTKLDLGLGLDPPDWFPPLERTIRSSGVGVLARYDSRDSIFTPDAGTSATVEATFCFAFYFTTGTAWGER